MRSFLSYCLILALTACGPPLKPHVVDISDLGITDPTQLGLPENFPLDLLVNNSIVLSPDPLVMENTPVGFTRTIAVLVINTKLTDVTLDLVALQSANTIHVAAGTCGDLASNILKKQSYCSLVVSFSPGAAGTITNQLQVDYTDDTSSNQVTSSIEATGTP